MKYERWGPFSTSKPLNATFLNGLEDFLAQIPSDTPYQRHGPFFNGLPISATFLNDIERHLSGATTGYQPLGPFLAGQSQISLFEIMDHVEEHLASLNETSEETS